ncbi:MAG: hypothetical protein AB1689_27830 [Thermodesulfobacteriota bacterium]
MRRSTVQRAACLAMAASLQLALLPGAASAFAQATAGTTAMPAGEIPDVLRARVGKPVTLLLRSGKEYGGTVGGVREQSVVLRNLTGKEFYDAVVRLDDVSAVEVRNR